MAIGISTSAIQVAIGCIVIFYVRQRYLRHTRSTSPLPPGPPGLPWVGNVVGVDANAPWLTYREWAKTYGDLVYVRVLGQDIIIINSERVAKDLLENRSSNTSGRPYFITSELCGIEFNSALMPYGDTWRLHRRFFHQTYRSDAVPRFIPLLNRKACQVLRQLLVAPEHLEDYIFEYTASIILSSAWDYDPSSREDELYKIVAKVQHTVSSVLRADTAAILTAFPTLLKLPAWLPGMSFKTDMATARKLAKQFLERGFAYSMQKPTGHVAPSMVHDALRSMEEKGTVPDQSWLDALKKASATSFLGGSETSHSALMTFFLLIMFNPKAQEKAQAQIDEVVGKNRLPTLEDRPSLPFVDAVFWETLRYSPVAPLSLPHAAVDDDVYDGFYIPKGTILLANQWSMAHDESKYPNPDLFIPERYLNDDGSLKSNDTEHITFGFGRRMCVGRHFADLSVWIIIANFLAAFKILKPLDENGVEIPMEPKFLSGLAVRPAPFPCRIIPRIPGMDAEKLEELIATSTA